MVRLTHKIDGYNQIIACGNNECATICRKTDHCYNCEIQKAINKLAEYEDLEEQGLLLKPPCRKGDKVYQITKVIDYGEVGDKGDVSYRIDETIFDYSMIDDIEKTIFITYEQAQQSLSSL